MIGRNPLADLHALAACPQVHHLAESLHELDPAGARRRSDPAALLMFLAGSWAVGSGNALESMLMTTGVWEDLRASAARGTFRLPRKPPTPDQVDQMLRRHPSIGHELLVDYVASAVDLARPFALMPRPWRFPDVRREHTVYADGTTFRHWTDLTEEMVEQRVAEGKPVAKSPRTQIEVHSKKAGTPLPGMGVEVVGIHTGIRWQRVLLSVRMYPDGDETSAAVEDVRRVKRAAGDGLHAVIYDRLLDGGPIHDLSRSGIVPLVPLKEPPQDVQGVAIPREHQVSFCGKNKERGRRGLLAKVQHPGRSCTHELWGVDGWVVTVKTGLQVRWGSPRCRLVDYRLESGPFGYENVAVLEVPCPKERFHIELRVTRGRADRRESSCFNVFRPFPDGGEVFQRVKGWRSDVESANATLKRMLPLQGRATRRDPGKFQFDLIGAGLLINAIAWDVHVSRHTECGALQARQIEAMLRRKADREAA